MSQAPLDVLGGLTAEQFLRDYWQQKPLLVRGAFNEAPYPASPEELAGLALEEGIESRLIQEQHEAGPWHLRAGPFQEQDFQQLPPSHWTLLIQQLDAWVPEANALKQHFRFIPDWRIDDIMASFAPEGGSVGPHFDYYDVFLIQSYGQREWRLGQVCTPDSPRVAGTNLNILAEFEESARHLLEPGDMLYLPPRLAHYGIAQNDCITLSVGFRAPSHRQAIEGMMEHLLEQTPEHLFVADATRERSAHPAEIDRATLQKVRETLIHYLNDEHQIAHWFGRFATEPKNPSILIPDESLADTRQLLQAIQNTELLCNEGSRIAYTLEKERLCLFIDGEDMALREYDLDWVQLLCDEQAIALTAIHSLETRDDLQCYLLNCIQQGSLLLEEIEH